MNIRVFVGTGGVGKTSVTAASALAAAAVLTGEQNTIPSDCHLRSSMLWVSESSETYRWLLPSPVVNPWL